jgi:PAS domain-containing protein
MPLEVQGRTSGAAAFVRFVSLGELQSAHARLKTEFEELNAAYLTLSALFDALPMPAWRRGLDGAVNWANRAYRALTESGSAADAAELFGEQARMICSRACAASMASSPTSSARWRAATAMSSR